MTMITRQQHSDPAEVALAALEMERTSITEFERNGMMFQRLVLPSIMEAMNRVIAKVGKAEALRAAPAYIAPMIVSVVSEVLCLCPPEIRHQTVDSLADQLTDSIRIHCASTFAQVDGLDGDAAASAEKDRIKAERAAKAGQ